MLRLLLLLLLLEVQLVVVAVEAGTSVGFCDSPAVANVSILSKSTSAPPSAALAPCRLFLFFGMPARIQDVLVICNLCHRRNMFGAA
jgi:hypothetical protein